MNFISTSIHYLINKSYCKSFLFIYLFTFLNLPVFSQEYVQKPIVVLITSYNNSHWVKRNLTTVFRQDYKNYRVIYIDDCSKDDTEIKARKIIEKSKQRERVTLISNTTRKGALQNIYDAVISCNDDEIIVSLDGDDWFPNSSVLKKINQAYSSSDIWLTHGTMREYPNQSTAWCTPVPSDIVKNNAFRTFRCPTHLRTFYAWLFKKIDVNDLKYQGQFFPMTWDQAIMFPMIEMAGERHAFIKDVVYVYNMVNAINDNKVNAQLQNDLESLIRSMPSYHRLESSPLGE